MGNKKEENKINLYNYVKVDMEKDDFSVKAATIVSSDVLSELDLGMDAREVGIILERISNMDKADSKLVTEDIEKTLSGIKVDVRNYSYSMLFMYAYEMARRVPMLINRLQGGEISC